MELALVSQTAGLFAAGEGVMIDHTGIGVSDFERSKAFYEKALEPLGYHVIMEIPAVGAGFGIPPKPDFWVSSGAPQVPPVHVAFRADTRAEVDAFYQAAIAAGGRDNGAPGLRPHYHPNYYGAFVLDPDGHNIEAVCHHKE
jgi:catechol 2,3-dioxygenase-like lactoylglutathione lyase family enzyme